MTTIQYGQAADRAVRRSPGRGRLPSRLPRLDRRRVLVIAFTGCGLAMLPWLAVLGFGLPGTAVAPHWNVAWAGLDALEAIGLFTTGRLLARGDRRYAITATLTGTALLTDAWFDVLTAASAYDLAAAALMAGVIELPLSCLCFFLAFRAVPGR